MTNYNERLDKILFNLTDQSAWDLIGITQEQANELSSQLDRDRAEAKQAFTSLMKELVAEAEPEVNCIDHYKEIEQYLDRFGENLLKGLENGNE